MASKGVNKAPESELYLSGLSIPQVSEITGIPKSTLRFRFKNLGILRSRESSIRLAAQGGRLGSGLRGKTRVFTESHRENIKLSAIKRGEETAKGQTVKPSGYIELTRGENKGRLLHVVIMEKRIGRRLKEDEVVHHIDRDKSNNNENNLALCTRSGHCRLHRFEDKLEGFERNRNTKGQFKEEAA